MKREDIIRDIHGLDTELAALEEQYGLLSADFYHCLQAGELEQTRDFIRWAGCYEAKLDRESRYRQMAYEHRVPAPGIQFDAPNLDVVMEDVRRKWLPLA